KSVGAAIVEMVAAAQRATHAAELGRALVELEGKAGPLGVKRDAQPRRPSSQNREMRHPRLSPAGVRCANGGREVLRPGPIRTPLANRREQLSALVGRVERPLKSLIALDDASASPSSRFLASDPRGARI